MIIDEAKKAVEELRAQGSSDDEIIASFYYGYKDGKINLAEFEILMQILGYTLSEEFLRNLPEEGEEEFSENTEEEDAMKLFGK